MLFKKWSSNQVLEYWKTIEDYPNYMVSSLGRVKSLERKVKCKGKGYRTVKEKILKPGFNRGYPQVILCKNGNKKKFSVHRLVAIAFIPNPKNKPCIDHIDTNPLNNSIKNLCWCTHKENMNNPLTLKKNSESKKGKTFTEERKKRLSESHNIPVIGVSIENEEVLELSSAKQGGELGFNPSHITQCAKGKVKQHGGYRWYYKEKYEENK